MRPWEILLDRIRKARRWPIAQEVPVRKMLRVWAALRENDEAVIRELMQWPSDRPLLIDNLPEKIATAYGDLLYGESPKFTAGAAADAERLAEMTADWPTELPSAVETATSEGEVWWRLSTDPAVEHPILSWHSRWDVVPLLRGRNVLACAFVSRLDPLGNDARIAYRHLEIHDAGQVRNLLFRGRDTALGELVDLGAHHDTEMLADLWTTEVPELLAGRIVHRWGRKPLVGKSIYNGVWQRALALNEATTIGRENMRLTAKKRAVVPASALKGSNLGKPELVDRGDGVMVARPNRARFDASEDVLVLDQLDASEDGPAPPFKVLEYSFEADQLLAWMHGEVETICQRCDIVPQFIGAGDFGQAESGTALRVRLIPTTNAGEGLGRKWDPELPKIAQRAALLEKQPVVFGGLGREEWSDPAALPSIEREDVLPVDEAEQAQTHATLKTADLISIEQSVVERHPDWSNDGPESQVQLEVARIRADIASTLPTVLVGTEPPPGEEEPPEPPGPQD